MVQEKQIITKRKRIGFYEECYKRYGYELITTQKYNMDILMELENANELSEAEHKNMRQMENKLRLIEMTERKKCGFQRLFLNLLVHILLFSLQAFILYQMHMEAAHPKGMLVAACVMSGVVLIFGFITKILEIFHWNKTLRSLKKEIQEATSKEEIHNNEIINDMENKKIISVLFTRGNGKISELIYWVTGRQYTHSAIGLGEQTEEFFSVDFRGFRVEHPAHRKIRHHCKNSLCYQFYVTENEYKKVEQNIAAYREKDANKKVGYNLSGAIFSVLHIYMPLKPGDTYFCSEFVSTQLRQLPSFRLKKAPNMYLPTNLAKALISQYNLYRVLVNEV